LERAKYYKALGIFETCLTSIVYHPGIIEPLRLLDVVNLKLSNLSQNRKIVLASGVFDLLHLGHVRFLEEAKKAGGENAELVVVVARDETVEKAKGKTPTIGEYHRAAVVESLKVVDRVVMGYLNFSISDIIDNIKPDVIALGYDQDDMMDEVQNCIRMKNLNIKIVRVSKFGELTRLSSSKIKQKIIDSQNGDLSRRRPTW
jgi:FAD synthetase